MSESNRVTIGDITEDLLPFTEKGNKVITIEIVPRKIVEDIIAKCREWEINNREFSNKAERASKYLYYAKAECYKGIAEEAIELLKQFEEGGKG